MIIVVLASYLRQVVKGHSTPNPATWFIWTVTTIMNAFSYFQVVDDFFTSLMTTTVAFGISSIFAYSLIRGKFGRLGMMEWTSLAMALVIGIFWQVSGNAVIANLLLQVILAISFIPTVRGLLKHELKEKGLPWNLSVLAYSLMILSILVDPTVENRLIALVYPIVNGVVGNGSVALIIWLQGPTVE